MGNVYLAKLLLDLRFETYQNYLYPSIPGGLDCSPDYLTGSIVTTHRINRYP
jgi:hypothetical protein